MANDSNIVILGAGMAGYGASYKLEQAGIRPTVYEKRPTYGGHTFSHRFDDGFTFDEGPHVSFTENKRIQDIFAEAVGGRFERIQTYVDNHWRGRWVKHPVMVNLHGLPEDLVVNCIRDFIAVSHGPEPTINNYEDWLVACYGETYAKTFPCQYTRKYHTADAADMTTDWIGKRLYRADIEEVLRGALNSQTPDVHYIDNFRYPTHGGFLSYLNPFEHLAQFVFDHEVTSIDPSQRTVTFAHGKAVGYDALISSLPLPKLMPMIVGCPPDVVEASQTLACSQAVLVNVGLKREECSPAHWRYVYDEDLVFTRLSFPHKFSRHTVPEGCCSIQAECYFSPKYKPLTVEPEGMIQPVIDDLVRIKVIEDPGEIIHRSVLFAPYANVIFDRDRPAAIETVRGYLEEVGITTCGRYGRWDYSWTDQSFVSGEQAAEQAATLV